VGNRLDNQVIIVTGAGRGIGAEVAKLLAADGASVVVNDLGGSLDGTGSSVSPADQTVQQIIENGGVAVPSFDSVDEYDAAGRIVQTAIDTYGRLDGLCHVAGILRDRMLFNMTEEEWDQVLKVHLYGAFNMVRNSIPHMIKQRYGRIVLFSSGSGLGASGQANYASAKEGMVGFTRGLAAELKPFNISVNAVYPGGATRMVSSIPETTTKLRERQRSTTSTTSTELKTQGGPIKGPMEASSPANNAPKAAYLCTKAGGSITGQVIGTSGWVMSLYSPRHVVHSIHKQGRWTLDELDRLIPISLGSELSNPVPPEPQREK